MVVESDRIPKLFSEGAPDRYVFAELEGDVLGVKTKQQLIDYLTQLPQGNEIGGKQNKDLTLETIKNSPEGDYILLGSITDDYGLSNGKRVITGNTRTTRIVSPVLNKDNNDYYYQILSAYVEEKKRGEVDWKFVTFTPPSNNHFAKSQGLLSTQQHVVVHTIRL